MKTFDITNVICINLKSVNEQQLFSFSETYLFDFEAVLSFKKNGVNKIWFDTTDEDSIISYEFSDKTFKITEIYCPITKKLRDSLLKVKPSGIPKMPINESSLANYSHFLSKGYDIGSKKMDDLLSKVNNVDTVAYKPNLVVEVIEDVVFDVDVILEKISDKGMDSLTKKEVDFLNYNFKK